MFSVLEDGKKKVFVFSKCQKNENLSNIILYSSKKRKDNTKCNQNEGKASSSAFTLPVRGSIVKPP
jgi:hypothetical protein